MVYIKIIRLRPNHRRLQPLVFLLVRKNWLSKILKVRFFKFCFFINKNNSFLFFSDKQLPQDFIEKTWWKLQEAVEAIQKQQPVSTTYEELYQSVENLCSKKQPAWLYDRLKNYCEKHVQSELPNLLEISQSGDSVAFLKAMNTCWQSHCDQMVSDFVIFFRRVEQNFF